MFGDFARGYGLGRVAKSTRKTYAQGWRMWVSWRMMRGKGNWLGNELGEWGLVEELTEFMAYCCAEGKNKEATVAGKLMAVNVYHEQWGGLSLPLQPVRNQAVKKGNRRAHAEPGNQARGKEAADVGDDRSDGGEYRRVGGRGEDRVDRAGTDISAAAEGLGTIRGGRRKGARGSLLEEGRCGLLRERGADGTGKEGSRGYGGDPFQGEEGRPGEKRRGSVTIKGSGGVGGGPERKVVDPMVELVGSYRKPVPGEENAPSTTYRSGGRWKVWRKGQATFRVSSGLERVGRKCKKQGRGAMEELVPEYSRCTREE